MDKRQEATVAGFPIVGMGACAGGLEAFEQFFRCCASLARLAVSLVLIALCILPRAAGAADTQSEATLDAVVLQLKWLHGFQFAGFYAAVEKGYYREEGLRVELKAGGPGIYSGEEVASGRAAFGVGSPNVLLDRLAGKPVVALAAIFQHSPTIVLARPDSRITNPASLAGRRVGIARDGNPEILAMLRNEGIDPGAIKIVGHSGRLDDLILGRIDAQSAYLTNEPRRMEMRGIAPAIIKPSDYGIDFYGDVLVTNEAEMKANPQRALAFLRATRRGWEYALAHPEELADLIIARYSPGGDREHLLYEARTMVGLINPDLVEIGHMNPGRWRHIADTYVKLGMAAPDYTLKGFLASDWLQARGPDWRPYAIGLGIFLVVALTIVGLLAMWNRQLRIAVSRQVGALRASEERSRAITQSAHDGVVTSDSSGNIVGWNPGAETIFGYTESDVMGQPLTRLMEERYRDGHLAGMNRIGSGGEHRIMGKAVELNGLRKSGSEFPLELSLAKWETTDGWFITGIIRDITERKHAEDALRNRDAQLREAQRIAGIGSWEWTLGSEIITWSEGLHLILGRDLDLGAPTYTNLQQFYTPESWERLGAAIARAIETGAPYELDIEMICEDGTTCWTTTHGEAVLGPDGVVMKLRGTVHDITERKQAEKEKTLLETQFQQAQKMDSVGRLAGGVAHDFNNMLTVILGNVAMAIEQVDSTQPIHIDLVEIRKAATRSADLTRQLLAFARKQVIEPKVLDLNQALAGIVKMLQRLIGEDISLKWVPETNLWPVKIDPSQLDQILANLCINARDAIVGVGNIAIETGNSTFDEDYCAVHAGFAPGDYVRISVSDNGHGIDKETLAHIFEPFFTTKGVGEGTGLGLATVYGVVKQNNGFINVYSEPDTGTTFTIYLPRHEGGAEQGSAAGEASPLVRGHETILLVEDEPSILKLTTRVLTRQGYAVLAASTPGEAIRVASEHASAIHLLMTDVVMPEMNGRDLAKNLQTRFPSLKLLFMSGYTANIIVHQGVLDQGVQFIQKPFSIDDLAAKVREVLDSE